EFATITVDGVEVELKDVPLEEWFAQYIVDAAQMNLVSGYADAEGNPTGEFGPADFVTIEQLAKMAVIAAGIDLYNCGDSLKNSSARGRWSQKYVQCAEYNRWIIFSDGIVDPSRPADRAEVVVTVIQAFSARVSPVSGTVFEDVTRATPYGNAVETAAGDGVVSGYSGSNGNPTGYFGPGDPVNRAETAKIFSLASQTYGKR
ncbi:MAG: S-layer homology domain-containing protein, partial [Candidatus Peribacteraceae bacterium]|nr:S-layer homology domain-containing protein [Candidatus Peribacteraceae bacterium]